MGDDQEDKQKHLKELIKTFRTAMLVTRASDGGLRGRPLSLADAHDDGVVYFATSIESPKVTELESAPDVAVTLQDSKRYVSITGTARITRDRALVERLWSETWKLWFPKGKDDPDLCVVVVTPREAEYWDQSGLKGITYLLEAAKAYAKGTTPESGGSSENAKVRL
jgi:general stress protein 26